jgi:hypothetical protein
MAMRLLSEGALDHMRTLLEATLLDTATVTTVTSTVDDMGSWTESESASAAVPCRITPAFRMGQEAAPQGVVQAVGLWTVVFSTRQLAAAGIAVTERSLIVARGVTYQIQQVLAPRTHDMSTRVLAVKAT